MRRLVPQGIAVRVALACLLVVGLAVLIIGTGVLTVARDQFDHLMMKHGSSAAEAEAMFQQTVAGIFAIAALIAVVTSVLLSIVLARYISLPLAELSRAARKISQGHHDSRVPVKGPSEIRATAIAFNSMAESLERQEQVRRDFIAGAAHELLTPLTNLKGYLEGLRDGVIEATPERFESLQEETERLIRLSRALLDLAEAQSNGAGPGDPMDLSPVIDSTVKLAAPSLQKRHIAVSVDRPPHVVARANRDHVTQVLLNLLQNAARYADEGSQVTVRANSSNQAARISVTNTGTTIAAEDLPRIFERFYRADKSRNRASGGQGLGLALTKELIEASGGEIGADSSNGVTTVWFTLPASA